VIGGGVIGLASAWSLARRGADVTVIERSRCGQGASAGNAGWVTPGLSAPVPAPGVMRQAARWMLDADSPLLVRPRPELSFLRWSLRFAQSCRPRAHRAGTEATLALARDAEEHFDLLRREGVEFEMHADGLLYLVHDESGLEPWLRAYEELAELGFDGDVVPLAGAELHDLEPAVDGAAAGLLARRERHVRPESLTAGLVRDLERRGATIEEGTAVSALQPNSSGWRIETQGGDMHADRVVVAAGVWSRELLRGAGVDLPLEPAKGYSVTARGPEPALGRPIYLTEAKVGASPFDDGSVRLAGTLELTGIDLGLNERRVGAVARATRSYLPSWRPQAGRRDWAGLRPLTADGVPAIGETRPGLFVATGHAMLGITLAPSTGEALAPAVLGEDPPEVLTGLSPLRFARGAAANGNGHVRPRVGAGA